jgi:tRNA(Glu) U13 pseudouridine synthase TruD
MLEAGAPAVPDWPRLRVKAAGLAWNLETDRLDLAFELPAGAYATALVRELVSEVQ